MPFQMAVLLPVSGRFKVGLCDRHRATSPGGVPMDRAGVHFASVSCLYSLALA